MSGRNAARHLSLCFYFFLFTWGCFSVLSFQEGKHQLPDPKGRECPAPFFSRVSFLSCNFLLFLRLFNHISSHLLVPAIWVQDILLKSQTGWTAFSHYETFLTPRAHGVQVKAQWPGWAMVLPSIAAVSTRKWRSRTSYDDFLNELCFILLFLLCACECATCAWVCTKATRVCQVSRSWSCRRLGGASCGC